MDFYKRGFAAQKEGIASPKADDVLVAELKRMVQSGGFMLPSEIRKISEDWGRGFLDARYENMTKEEEIADLEARKLTKN